MLSLSSAKPALRRSLPPPPVCYDEISRSAGSEYARNRTLTAMIDSYTFGRIVIDGKEYTRDVIIYPDRVDRSWRRKQGHELAPEDIPEILKFKPETLVVGQSHDGCMEIAPETKRVLELAKTGGRAVAALHLTC